MHKLITLFLLLSFAIVAYTEESCLSKPQEKYYDLSSGNFDIYDYLNFKYTQPIQDREGYTKNYGLQCSHRDKVFFENLNQDAEKLEVIEFLDEKNKYYHQEGTQDKKQRVFKKGKDSYFNKESWKIKYFTASRTLPDDIEIYDKDSKEHYLDEFDNKTLLIVFWATWSSGCLSNLVALDDLKKDFRKLPFEVITISEDYQDTSKIENYFKANNLRYLTSYHDKRNKLFKVFEVIGLPTAFLISFDGEMIASIQGAVNWYDEEIRQLLLSYIKTEDHLPKNSYKDKSLNYQFKIVEDPNKRLKAIEKPNEATKKEGSKSKPLEDNIDKPNNKHKKQKRSHGSN